MSMLSDEYCEGWCADGCKGSWEDCTGCAIHKIESQLSAEREARERLEAKVERREQEAREWKREWDILESACDFWKQEANIRGYEE